MHILTKYRKEAGVSQRAFAELIGVDQSLISRWEAGANSPTLPVAFKIEAVTGGKVPAASWAVRSAPRGAA